MLHGETFVVDSERVQDGGVEVVDVHWVFEDVVGVIVGFAVIKSLFESTACDPRTETSPMVITAVAGFGQLALAVDRSSKLTAKDHYRVLQHAPLFQVLDQGDGRLIHALAVCGEFLGQVAVLVPAPVE